MSLAEILNIWPNSPVLSVIIALSVAVFLLYPARNPAHKVIYSLSRVIHNGFRLMARSVLIAEKKVVERNKEVLLTAGAKAVERLIEPEFHHVDAVVKRDICGYPVLQKDGGSPTFSHELSFLCSEAEADSSVILPTNRS